MRIPDTEPWARRRTGPWHWITGRTPRSWPKTKCGKELTGDPTQAHFEGLPPYPEDYQGLDAQAKARIVCPQCAQAYLDKQAERGARKQALP